MAHVNVLYWPKHTATKHFNVNFWVFNDGSCHTHALSNAHNVNTVIVCWAANAIITDKHMDVNTNIS